MSPGSQNLSSIEQNFKPNISKWKLYKTITAFNNTFYLEYIKISIMFSSKYVVSKERSAKLHLKFYVKITVFYSVIFIKKYLKILGSVCRRKSIPQISRVSSDVWELNWQRYINRTKHAILLIYVLHDMVALIRKWRPKETPVYLSDRFDEECIVMEENDRLRSMR